MTIASSASTLGDIAEPLRDAQIGSLHYPPDPQLCTPASRFAGDDRHAPSEQCIRPIGESYYPIPLWRSYDLFCLGYLING